MCSNASIICRDQGGGGPAAPQGPRSQEPKRTRRWQGKPRDGSWGQLAVPSPDQLVMRRQLWGDTWNSICRSGSGPAAVNRARCSLVIAREGKSLAARQGWDDTRKTGLRPRRSVAGHSRGCTTAERGDQHPHSIAQAPRAEMGPRAELWVEAPGNAGQSN